MTSKTSATTFLCTQPVLEADVPARARKAPYRAPQLTRYGEVRSLTQAGTKNSTELVMGGPNGCGLIRTLMC